MKKKALLLLASLALVTTLAVNGTLAQELREIAQSVKEFFLDVTRIDSPTPAEGLDVKVVSGSGDQTLAPSHYSEKVFPGVDKVKGAVTNTTYVQNNCNKDVYVRISIYVKNDPVLKHNAPTTTGPYMAGTVVITNNYYVYNFDYTAELPGKTESTIPKTEDIYLKVALIKEATNTDMAKLGEGFVQVKAFAIEADAFVKKDANNQPVQMSATEALNAALGDINSFNPFN